MIQIQEKFTQYCLLRFLEWFAHLCHSDWLVDRKVIFFKLAILTSQVLICWLTIYVNLLNTLVILMLYIPDYVVVGSDSGRIVILEYIAQKNIFEKVCF